MLNRNGRTNCRLALVLAVSTILFGCSEDASVDMGPLDPVKGRSCFDFSRYLHIVSFVDTPGASLSSVLVDGLAYVADSDNGLQIVDYRVPAAPVLRGGVATPDPVVDVSVSGTLACLSVGPAGILVVDASDPDDPSIVGETDTPGTASGILVRDSIAYVADDLAGLILVDVSDPVTPFTSGVDNSSGEALDVDVDGAFAYVADRQKGLKVVNVNNPTDPWWVEDVPAPNGGRAVVVSDGLAFLATGDGELLIVDVSEPGAASVVGSLAAAGAGTALALDPSARIVFFARGWGGVDLIDVSDPAEPRVVNSLTSLADASGVSTERGVTVISQRERGLEALDSSSPPPPPVTAGMPGDVTRVVSGAGAVFATGPDAGLFTVEAGDSALHAVGTLALQYDIAAMHVHGDTAFLASEDGGIEMINVADPAAMRPVGWVPYEGRVASLDASGDFLCFAAGREFATWVRGEPEVSTVDVSSNSSAVELSGGYAYVGSSTGWVRAVNVQIPSQPLLMSTTSAQGGVIEIMGTDGSLVVLTSSRGTSTTRNGVAIYDLPLPIQLVPGAFMELMDGPRFAALADGYLYVAVGATGMVVVDLNDPAGPRLIGTVPSDNSSQGVAVADGAVFVADGPGGLFTVPAQRCTPAH